MPEDRRDQLNRELIELLNELRVALPGVQVLFAFLLIVPFSQGFGRVTSAQQRVYFVAFLATAVATVLLIAPSSYHRLRWREQDKEHILATSNSLFIAGLVFLALAVTATVFFISDVLYSRTTAYVTTAVVAVLFATFWYAIPLQRAARE
jgi:predicted membrane channel-forming protein YqfA (hemolysin III family)